MRALDLFCKAGGASMGLYRAGFEVVGVDIEPQPRYPFEFHRADALTFNLDGFDSYFASPPCQGYSRTRSLHKHLTYPKLIEPIRERLAATGKPYIIENVVGSPLLSPMMLCGAMFGLRTYRHRLFESNVLMFQPRHPRHIQKVLNRGWNTDWPGFFCVCGGGNAPLAQMKVAMGIDWMVREELTEAIPPAYTEFLGKWLIKYIKGR